MAIRIVLADDHRAYREVVRQMLERQPGFEVIAEASNGAEAVDAERAHAPDVVVMDIEMPGIDGIEATRIIVASRPAARVVALSLYSDARFVAAVLAAGAVGYVLKQDSFSNLVTAISEAAAGRTFLSPSVAASAQPRPQQT